jgi:hypothetical protein
MQRAYTSMLIAAIVTVAAGQAMAADSSAPVTRDQAQAELTEARRTGNIVDPESNLKLNQAFPSRYPAQVVAQGKTREQVKAELADAIRFGDMVDPETQQKLNQVYPNRYPTRAAVQAQAQARDSIDTELTAATASGVQAR